MAAPPGKRSPRKTPSNPAQTPQRGRAQPPLVDPETVAAVSRATAKAAHRVVKVSVSVAAFTAAAAITAARWTGPRLRTLGKASARTLWMAARVTGRWLWTRKGSVARAGHRVLWWAALAILVLVGRALLSADGDPELVGAAVLWFAVGLSMSVLVLLGAPEKRMRFAAVALAGGHGSLAALAWIACV
jgi:hypothetical protein